MKAIILTILVTGCIAQLHAQKATAFGPLDYYHTKVVDNNNLLDSWHKDQNGPFEFILGLSAGYWKNAPDINGWPIWCTAALLEKPYIQGAGAIPGSACPFAIMSCLRYYVYTGDTSFLYMARRTGEYIVNQDLTPTYFASYPDFPYAVGETGDVHPQGTGHPNPGDPVNPVFSIQPDKGWMIGMALLELYKVTGNHDFLKTSINIANSLSDNAVPGDATRSPWPMRVMADDGRIIDGRFSANVSYSCRLFDELLRIGQAGNGKYKSTRDAVWNWLKTNVIAFDDGSKWYNFFEDHGGDEDNSTQINALETVRYLLEKKDKADPDWFDLSGKIINQVTRRWSVTSLQKDGYISIGEQDRDMTPYNSHSARYGSILAMYYEAGAGSAYKDTAYHSLCYSLYSVEDDGFTNTYFSEGGYAWTTDSFGDFIGHYVQAMAAVPEWTGRRNCLLKSTSTVTKISYDPSGDVIYSTFDAYGIDKMKLTQKPVSILVDGEEIGSFVWDQTSNVLIITRSTGKNVTISMGNEPSGIPDSNIRIYPNPTTGSLILELDQSLSAGSDLEVLDNTGRLLLHKSLTEGVKHDLELGHLSPGLYIIRVMKNNKYHTQKVVIK